MIHVKKKVSFGEEMIGHYKMRLRLSFQGNPAYMYQARIYPRPDYTRLY